MGMPRPQFRQYTNTFPIPEKHDKLHLRLRVLCVALSKFDRVLEPLHAGSSFGEVHVKERSTNLNIAILLTILDAAVALHYGPVIWQTWSGILWSRLLLILLGAVWLISLANVWARAHYEFRHSHRAQHAQFPSEMTARSVELRGEGDV